MTGEEPEIRQVGIIGMGYVGLTLAAALARRGYEVHGVDTQPELLDTLSKGRPHIFEPGVEDVFREWVGRRIFLSHDLPDTGVDAAVICVSTPVGESGAIRTCSTSRRRPSTSRRRARRGRWSWCAAPFRSARRGRWCCPGCSTPGDRPGS